MLVLRTAYPGCPLCYGKGTVIRSELCSRHGVDYALTWMKCGDCGHVHTSHYFDEEEQKRLLSAVTEDGIFGGGIDEQRVRWGFVVERILRHVHPLGRWVDVGVGNGGFLFTASEFGLDVTGIDIRPFILEPLQKLGYKVELADAMEYDYRGSSVVVLADIIEHMPYPKELLKRIREQTRGALFVSCPNMDTVSWRYSDSIGKSPYWTEPEHFHNFTRARLEDLLRECGFTPVDYAINSRYTSGMDVIAI